MSVGKVARPGSEYGDVLALFAPSHAGVVMEVEGTPDQDGEIQVEVGECSCYGDSHRAYLGPEERKALVAWLTAIDGATRVTITEEAIEAFDVERNGSEPAGNIREGLRGALEALGFEVEE